MIRETRWSVTHKQAQGRHQPCGAAKPSIISHRIAAFRAIIEIMK
jgi:hypothetical protein